MPVLRQVSRAEATDETVLAYYNRLFGERDPVAEPGTATGTPGDWWTVFALAPDIFKHAVDGFAVYRHPARKIDPVLRELGQTRAGWIKGEPNDMMVTHFEKRFDSAAVTATAACAVALAAPAAAHVKVTGDATQGGWGVLNFRVPTESDTASTTALLVVLPDDQPIISVSTQQKAGWTPTKTLPKRSPSTKMFAPSL